MIRTMLRLSILAAFALAAGLVSAQTGLPDAAQCIMNCATQAAQVAGCSTLCAYFYPRSGENPLWIWPS
jgi:hypothetical protein